MAKKFLIGFAAAIAVLLVVVALQPSDFRITRSATIAAPATIVFPLVNDFHNWESWSPWAKKDPQAKNSFEGPASGAGSKFSWAGNKDVGVGSMEITESRPSDLVRLRLDFLEPMKSTADTEFTFTPQGDQTTVTWTMTGKNNFVGRLFCLFMNMDKMVGGDFEKGLASMKALAEASKS